MHPFIHSLIHQSINQFIHSFIHSFTNESKQLGGTHIDFPLLFNGGRGELASAVDADGVLQPHNGTGVVTTKVVLLADAVELENCRMLWAKLLLSIFN